MDCHLGYYKNDVSNKKVENSRKSYTIKNVRSEFGPIKIDIYKDRKKECEPKIVP